MLPTKKPTLNIKTQMGEKCDDGKPCTELPLRERWGRGSGATRGSDKVHFRAKNVMWKIKNSFQMIKTSAHQDSAAVLNVRAVSNRQNARSKTDGNAGR